MWSTRDKALRLLWYIIEATLFRCSFRTMNRWRVFLLRCFGAEIGRSCVIRRTVCVELPWNLRVGEDSCLGYDVTLYALGPITIGNRVTISQNAHLCAGTHDYTRLDFPLIRTPITIEDDAWIAADTFVGPNVTIGEGAILGARGCAFKDLKPWTIYGGNPAKPIGVRPQSASGAPSASAEGLDPDTSGSEPSRVPSSHGQAKA